MNLNNMVLRKITISNIYEPHLYSHPPIKLDFSIQRNVKNRRLFRRKCFFIKIFFFYQS